MTVSFSIKEAGDHRRQSFSTGQEFYRLPLKALSLLRNRILLTPAVQHVSFSGAMGALAMPVPFWLHFLQNERPRVVSISTTG
jgi:hypothetical protein